MKLLKYIFFIASFFIVANSSFAQTTDVKIKKINVSGSAEMEIIPDELYFTVVLREYLDKDKKKISIETLEKELQSSVSAAGIAKENLQFENVYGERWKEKKGKPEDFMQSKRYIIKLSEPSKIDVILDKTDPKGIEKVFLSSYSHSKIEQYRKELKIQAIKNAKEKARYLLEAIGEQLGQTISISEGESYNEAPVVWDLNPSYYSNTTSQTSYDFRESSGSGINFKTIKLRFAISAEFAIK